MRLPKGTLSNPKYVEMVDGYKTLLKDLGERNGYLVSIIERARLTRPLGDRRFGYTEAGKVIRLFDSTGHTESVRSDADIQDPQVFWDLADKAKEEYETTGSDKALRGVNFLFENLDKKGTLGQEFIKAPKSPYPFLRKNSFLRWLRGEFTRSGDVYVVESSYREKSVPLLLCIPCGNTFLRDVIVDAVRRGQSRYEATKEIYEVLCRMTDIFGPYTDSIRSLTDLNAEMLTYAKDKILRDFADNRRMRVKAMQHLWTIFRHAVLTYPEHEFFKDSHLWNSTLIINHRVPVDIAKGFVPVIIESYGSIPAYEKVLYVYTNGEYFGANGITYGMFSIDFSCIRTENYRWLAINYIATSDQRKHPIVTAFLTWLEGLKRRPGHKYPRTDWVYADELCAYHVAISQKTKMNSTRNVYTTTLVSFLKWSAGTGRIHLQKDAFKYFQTFKNRYTPKPMSLTTCKKKAIEKALRELAQENPRFQLVLTIFLVTLRSNIRTGQLCALDLRRMKWNENGTSSYLSRVKNRGGSMVETEFTKTVTSTLRDAVKATEGIRADCPVEGPKTCLFLYRGLRPTDDEFAVMDVQRYNQDLKTACRRAGVPLISSGNVRDTRQTAVTKFAHKHKLNDAQLIAFSGHACRTSLNSYVDLHIEDLLMAAESITLGNTDKKD